jgi:hypothetical protein
MLEVFAIIMLVNKNKENAIKRGKKPGLYIFLTILLWVGLEILGGALGASMELGYGSYALAILFAAIGALTSYLIAKYGKKGDYVPPAKKIGETLGQAATPLNSPAQIVVVRDSSMVGALVRWDFTLNSKPIGSLSNGTSMTVTTNQRQNMLIARDAYGNDTPPLVFDVLDGGMAEVHFKAGKFVPNACSGIYQSTLPGGQNGSNPAAPTNPPAAAAAPVSAAATAPPAVPASPAAAVNPATSEWKYQTIENGPGVLSVRFSIEKLNELGGSYGFQSGRLIGKAVHPSLLEGMTISDGDSAATLRENEYVCIVSISTPFNRSLLKEKIEPLILADNNLLSCGSYPVTAIEVASNEPLVANGVVRNGRIEGKGGWCANGFATAWKERGWVQ